MINTFNICDFGAVPDGVTDCTAAIQAALDKAGACMGEVIVPPGVYMTGRLTMKEHTKISGSAAWRCGNGYGGSVLRLNTANTDCMIDITGAFGCQISGLSIDGCRLGEKIHGINLHWPKNNSHKEDCPTIDDCKIGHFTGDGVHLENIFCFTVRHSTLCHNNGAGLYVDGWDGFVLDNWLSGNDGGGMVGGPFVASLTCTGNRVEWNTVGGFVFPWVDVINITGNYFDRSGGPAIKLGVDGGNKMDTITITGNIIYRSGKPGSGVVTEEDSAHAVFKNCVNMTFTGNALRLGRDDGGRGSYSPNISLVIRDCDYCIFTSNAMHNAAIDEGIRWDGKGHCHFDTNFDDPKPSIRG